MVSFRLSFLFRREGFEDVDEAEESRRWRRRDCARDRTGDGEVLELLRPGRERERERE
jgi:hypothetical protein